MLLGMTNVQSVLARCRADQWPSCCRKVQQRFAWLDEKNARDTEGHSPKHPVSYNWSLKMNRRLNNAVLPCANLPLHTLLGSHVSPDIMARLGKDVCPRSVIRMTYS